MVAVLIIAIGGVAAALAFRGPSPFDKALEMLESEDGFATATDAGTTLVRVSSLLQDAGEDCAGDSGDDDPECVELFVAAGYARVNAVSVLTCTKPGIFEARQSMRTYLLDLDEEGEAKQPPMVNCVPPSLRGTSNTSIP